MPLLPVSYSVSLSFTCSLSPVYGKPVNGAPPYQLLQHHWLRPADPAVSAACHSGRCFTVNMAYSTLSCLAFFGCCSVVVHRSTHSISGPWTVQPMPSSCMQGRSEPLMYARAVVFTLFPRVPAQARAMGRSADRTLRPLLGAALKNISDGKPLVRNSGAWYVWSNVRAGRRGRVRLLINKRSSSSRFTA